MAVPRNCIFGENIAHRTFIVTSVLRGAVIAAVVTRRRVAISVIIAGRTITRVTIPASVARVVGRIGISVGCVWVAPVRAPPRTPPPWRGEVADKDDLVEMLKATKPTISIKVSIVETVKASKAQD